MQRGWRRIIKPVRTEQGRVAGYTWMVVWQSGDAREAAQYGTATGWARAQAQAEAEANEALARAHAVQPNGPPRA